MSKNIFSYRSVDNDFVIITKNHVDITIPDKKKLKRHDFYKFYSN
jgi:hypothetical protein